MNFACGLLLLSLGACDEPSTVGAELIGDESGDPEAVDVRLLAEQDTLAPVTGNAGRVLAGTVHDPLLGTITAAGYLDFTTSEADSSFRNDRLQAVFLDLSPNYAYGDTTGVVRLRLREMATEWEAGNATADTSLLAGRPITEFIFSADDTLVTVRLPDAWVRENADALQADDADERFHGFQLEPLDGAAVAGFGAGQSRLRAVAGEDTTRFTVDKHLTTVRRSGPSTLPPNQLVIQDGTGLSVHFDIDSTALPSGVAALNHAELRLQVAEEATGDASDFYRPPPERLRLYGIPREDDTGLVRLLDLQRTEEGAYVLNFQNRERLRQLFQEWLLREPPFQRLRLVPVPSRTVSGGLFNRQVPINTLNTTFFYGVEPPPACETDDDQTCAPHLQLVYTPVE